MLSFWMAVLSQSLSHLNPCGGCLQDKDPIPLSASKENRTQPLSLATTSQLLNFQFQSQASNFECLLLHTDPKALPSLLSQCPPLHPARHSGFKSPTLGFLLSCLHSQVVRSIWPSSMHIPNLSFLAWEHCENKTGPAQPWVPSFTILTEPQAFAKWRRSCTSNFCNHWNKQERKSNEDTRKRERESSIVTTWLPPPHVRPGVGSLQSNASFKKHQKVKWSLNTA